MNIIDRLKKKWAGLNQERNAFITKNDSRFKIFIFTKIFWKKYISLVMIKRQILYIIEKRGFSSVLSNRAFLVLLL